MEKRGVGPEALQSLDRLRKKNDVRVCRETLPAAFCNQSA
jgi:hypothetical protein